MPSTLTTESKNNNSLNLESKGAGKTWDEAVETWDEAEYTWDQPENVFGVNLEAKNSNSLSLEAKS